MGGSTYSRRKQRVVPSERDTDYVNTSKYFRGTVEEEHIWSVEKLKHPFDVKQIPIDKLWATKRKIPFSRVQREEAEHNKMTDYEPITVIKIDKRYIVTSGMERVVALASKGYKKIKARVYYMDK